MRCVRTTRARHCAGPGLFSLPLTRQACQAWMSRCISPSSSHETPLSLLRGFSSSCSLVDSSPPEPCCPPVPSASEKTAESLSVVSMLAAAASIFLAPRPAALAPPARSASRALAASACWYHACAADPAMLGGGTSATGLPRIQVRRTRVRPDKCVIGKTLREMPEILRISRRTLRHSGLFSTPELSFEPAEDG
jgi:hypothetical protein